MKLKSSWRRVSWKKANKTQNSNLDILNLANQVLIKMKKV